MGKPQAQSFVCAKVGSEFVPPNPDSKVGIALSTLSLIPLNAVRHDPEGETCGWYIWGGEVLSEDPDFFQPLHVHHLVERCPDVVPYLALAPGWRFLLAPGYEDVWFDPRVCRSSK